jgi:hypothetical protein
MKRWLSPKIFLLLSLTGCVSIRAPDMDGSSWSGQDSLRLNAQLRYASSQLPEGWLLKVQQIDAFGSFAYRKRSGTYDYSEHGYFAVDSRWRSEPTYIGLLKAGGIFCVVNPEMQSEIIGDTVAMYRVYDYCVQLRSQ